MTARFGYASKQNPRVPRDRDFIGKDIYEISTEETIFREKCLNFGFREQSWFSE